MQPLEPFDPPDPGMPESAWRRWFHRCNDRCAEWRPPSGPLLVVAPHPDDEVLGAGGLLHSWAMSGQPVTVLSVSDGEASDPDRLTLASIRRAELRDALRRLSPMHVEIERLGLPDGRLHEHKNRLRPALQQRARQPTTIIAPYEHDGHPDHEAVGEVCLEVARTAGLAIARYPIWAWHHATPDSVRALRWGLFRLEAAAQRAKRRALQCFESQLHPPRGAPIVPPHVLAHFERPFEAFIL